MSGKMKGNSKISGFLDRLLLPKYSFWVPVAVSIVLFILFLIFGRNSDKENLIVDVPVFALLSCAGILIVLGFQLINPFCSPKAMDWFELIILLLLYWSAIVSVLTFLFDMREGFSESTLGIVLSLSVLSFIHSRRK